MPLTYGAYTACLQDRSLPEALDVLKDAGLTGAEVNVGGFIPSPHCPVDALLASATARAEYLGLFQDKGMTLSGLNTSGNPTSPLPNEGLKHAEDIRAAIRLAGLLGVKEIVTMSGTPGTDPSATYPTWVVNPWNGIDMEILDYQWSVVVPFFKEIDALARDNDVQVCLELHPRNLVFNVPSFERLVEETGATNIKVNMDPSHLFWQQMDPIAATRRLGPLVGHVHAKDTRILPGAAYRGVLDTDFGHVPAEAEGKVPVAYGYWCNSWPQDPAWRFVALGLGHDTDYWAEFLTAIAEVDPEMNVNIEHEDAEYGNVEGLRISAKNLLAAARLRSPHTSTGGGVLSIVRESAPPLADRPHVRVPTAAHARAAGLWSHAPTAWGHNRGSTAGESRRPARRRDAKRTYTWRAASTSPPPVPEPANRPWPWAWSPP